MEIEKSRIDDSEVNSELKDITVLQVAIIGGLVVIAYLAYFHNFPLGEKPDSWGAFGSYFGGILGPIVSFAALWWFKKSVRLQQKELRTTIRISAVAALATATDSRLQSLNIRISQLESAIENTHSFVSVTDSKIYDQNVESRAAAIKEAIQMEAELKACRDELSSILRAYR